MSFEVAYAGGPALTLKPNARARTMRLRVDTRTGGVVLSFPARLSRRRALAWAAEQRGWIEAALSALPARVALIDGAEIPVRGEPHRIVWDQDLSRRVFRADGKLCVGGPPELVETRVTRWLKSEAMAALSAATDACAAKAGVGVERVGVGDPVSRWGSCSTSGAIRYSWRLILAPGWVLAATVAHEVAHRVHMDHGPRFHALVARLYGDDPSPAREWLRLHGAGLHRYGRR